MSELLHTIADALLASSPDAPGSPGGGPWSGGPPIGTGPGGPQGFPRGPGDGSGSDGRGGGDGAGGDGAGGDGAGGDGDGGSRRPKKRVTLPELIDLAKKAAEEMFDIAEEVYDFGSKDYEDMTQDEKDLYDAMHGKPDPVGDALGDVIGELADKVGPGAEYAADQAEKVGRAGAAPYEGYKARKEREEYIRERIRKDTQQDTAGDD